jgi:hypothetical protein
MGEEFLKADITEVILTLPFLARTIPELADVAAEFHDCFRGAGI